MLNIEKGECDHVEKGSLAPQQTQPPQRHRPVTHPTTITMLLYDLV